MPITPLKRAIFESGRTQRAVAAEVGIDEAHLSRLCNGLHCAEPTRLKIAAVLGRDVNDVFVTDVTQEAA